jgi:hypothetical protein
LVVEITHHATGNAAGTRSNGILIDHDHVFAGTATAGLEFFGQVPGGAEAVNPGANDQVGDMLWYFHLLHLICLHQCFQGGLSQRHDIQIVPGFHHGVP